jgi:hypothetical protein
LGSRWNAILDLNFDGYADLCVDESSPGDHFYTQRCWLFDPDRRTFVREQALDPLIFVEVDEATKTLRSQRPAGGDVWVNTEYQWMAGTLMMTVEEVTRPTQPDGSALPLGFNRWRERKERRNGRLVPVVNGPEHERHKTDVRLRPSDPPCALVLDGHNFRQGPDGFFVEAVTRVVTEAGAACSAAVLYDLTQEAKAQARDPDPVPLHGGEFQKAQLGAGGNVILDLNFDGYADICIEADFYSQRCWLFDPGKRTFVREMAFDDLNFVGLDAATKKLRSKRRAKPETPPVGDVWVYTEHHWKRGKLVLAVEEVTRASQPNGQPLPTGLTRWRERKERRGGQMVTVFKGPDVGQP